MVEGREGDLPSPLLEARAVVVVVVVVVVACKAGEEKEEGASSLQAGILRTYAMALFADGSSKKRKRFSSSISRDRGRRDGMAPAVV